jgi:hypothetical protein
MTAPRYRNKLDGSVVQAIQFVQDDERTHWHVNRGDHDVKGLENQYWCNTSHGREMVDDLDWIVQSSVNQRDVMTPLEFGLKFEPLPEEPEAA